MNEASGRELTVRCEGPVDAFQSPAGDIPLNGDEVAVWAATLDELRPFAQDYTSLLDLGERGRMARFRFEPDKERFLLGHGLLRTVLGHYLRLPPENIRFQRGRFGKPFIPDMPINFNLSDTKDAVAIAVSAHRDLGVDVETMSRVVDHEAVGEHYFTMEEVASINGSPDGKRRFLEFWTRKEAVLKASGVGIMDDLRVLRVDEAVNRMTITHDAFIAMAAPVYHVRTWHLGASHIVSLASSTILGTVHFLSVH